MEKDNKEVTQSKISDDHVDEVKWGTKVMGAPAPPLAHPENQRAALFSPRADDERPPYVVLEPEAVPKHGGSPMEHILDFFNSWTKKAEDLAQNIWHNINIASNKTEAAMGKLSLNAKALLTEGGYETLYKQTFHAEPNEKLKKTFACYLSTATGPVAGTLYLTNLNVAFCSDRPLSFKAPSGQDAWSYYKVVIPIAKIATVKPVTLNENPPQKYIEIVTADGFEFWFMGFVYFDKAIKHLEDAVVASFSSQTGPQVY